MSDDAERNVSTGNLWACVLVESPGTDNTVIAGNFLGTDVTGAMPLSTSDGILIRYGPKNTRIGTDGSNDAFNANERNVISGNPWNGINIVTPNWDGAIPPSPTDQTIIAGNYIGTDVTGTAAVPNYTGILIQQGATNTRIGTDGNGNADEAERNVISGNASDGIQITGVGTTGTLVAGNYVGTDATGMLALGNHVHGVAIDGGASNNTIGGSTAAARNIISGNAVHGVDISGTATNFNTVSGNYIGTNVSGNAALGNGDRGIYVHFLADNNTIGGLTATPGTGAGNVISGNTGTGIGIIANNTVISGNIVGLNADGNAALGNGGNGVFILFGGFGNTLGGSAPGAKCDFGKSLSISGGCHHRGRRYQDDCPGQLHRHRHFRDESDCQRRRRHRDTRRDFELRSVALRLQRKRHFRE